MINQSLPAYSLRRLAKSHLDGVTRPVSGSIDAVVKFDGPESPHCVYSEMVAVRLARVLGIPIAEGVLTQVGTRQGFASLRLASRGWAATNVPMRQWPVVASRYPEGVVALTIFDIFIGNDDRGGNFTASVVTPHLSLFQGFDHSHALLCCRRSAPQSVRALRGAELIVKNHPFYRLIQRKLLGSWVERIAALPDEYVNECCILGQPVGAVSCQTQAGLGRALVVRKNQLHAIVNAHLATILPQ